MNQRILPPHPPLSPTGGEDKGEGVWIVVPVFNEAASLGAVVAKARRHGPVLVVDDGSTDGSAAVARAAGAEVLSHGRRRGKGAALRTGADMAIARGAAEFLTLDGDGQHDPDEIPLLLEDARRNPGVIVIGGRLHSSGVIPPGRMNALKVAGFFINWLTGTQVRDTQSGFRLYPARLFGQVTLRRGGFVLESEILLAARRAGYDIREVPVTAIHHTGRRSRFHPVQDGCAIGLFLARHALVRLGTEAWWRVRGLAAFFSPAAPRSQRQLRLIGAAVLAFPMLLLLTLLHPLTARVSVDILTPFVRRFYSQDRLAQSQNSAPTPGTVELGRAT